MVQAASCIAKKVQVVQEKETFVILYIKVVVLYLAQSHTAMILS